LCTTKGGRFLHLLKDKGKVSSPQISGAMMSEGKFLKERRAKLWKLAEEDF
jgi:hypothetical protein